MADSGDPKIAWFTTRGLPELSAGNWTTACGTTRSLRQRVKVCAVGEGNPLHAHTKEDHAYFVLQGSAIFAGIDGVEITVGSFDGIIIPKGAFYSFVNRGTENLIMLMTFATEVENSNDQENIEVPAGAADFVGSAPGVVVPGRVFDPH